MAFGSLIGIIATLLNCKIHPIYYPHCRALCPQANPIINSNEKRLIISKSTHHPTNKKPHEGGVCGLVF